MMGRRSFLAATTGSVAALAGCNGNGSEDSITVELEPMTYLAGAARPVELRQRAFDPDEVRDEAEIPAALREALSDARRGGFETGSVSDELLAAIDEFREPRNNYRLETPYVRLDGTEYVFEASVPTLVLELADETVEDADPDAVFDWGYAGTDVEGLDPAVEAVLDRVTYGGPNAPRLPYRTSLVPEAIAAFLDEYDYVEDSQGISRIAVERRDWEPPYTIGLRELGPADRYGRRVVDGSELGTELREFLGAVVEAEADEPAPPFLTDEVPGEYFEVLQPTGNVFEDPFVRLDDTVYYVAVVTGDHEGIPADVSVESGPAGGADHSRFTMTVEATDGGPETGLSSGDSIELFGHVGLPSVLWVTHDGESTLLDSESYEYPVESESVTTSATDAAIQLQVAQREFDLLAAEEEGESTAWSIDVDIQQIRETTVTAELPVGEELSATYEIPGTIPDGTYTAPGFFGVTWNDGTDHQSVQGEYPFRVALTI